MLFAHIDILTPINLTLSFGEVLLKQIEKALVFLFGQSRITHNYAAEVVKGFSYYLAIGGEDLSISDIGEIDDWYLLEYAEGMDASFN